MTLVLLFEAVDFVADFVQRTYLVQRQSHDTALFCNSLQDGLANPPYSIGNELEASRFVELLCGLNQTNVTLINQVSKRQSLMLILLGYRYYEPEVGCYQLVLGALAFRTALAYFLSQLDFFVDADQRRTADFHQILIQCFT